VRIAVSGGGTGGHTFPALAIIQELGRRDPALDLLFIGKRGNLEERVAAAETIPFRAVTCAPWHGTRMVARPVALACLAWGTLRATLTLLRFKPQVVVVTGGYVSLPTAIASAILRLPLVVHEQNRRPGLSNRIAGRFATVVALSYADSSGTFPAPRTTLTGMPVRAGLLTGMSKEQCLDLFSLESGKFTVFVFGGSQGARSLNAAILDVLARLDPDRFQVLISTGKTGYQEVSKWAETLPVRVCVKPFIEQMAEAYAAADLVVCRAGASTLAEIAFVGVPSILVPYPYAAEGHQEINAKAFQEVGASTIILDRELSGKTLANAILTIADDERVRDEMAAQAQSTSRPEAAEAIVDLIFGVVFGQSPQT